MLTLVDRWEPGRECVGSQEGGLGVRSGGLVRGRQSCETISFEGWSLLKVGAPLRPWLENFCLPCVCTEMLPPDRERSASIKKPWWLELTNLHLDPGNPEWLSGW